MSTSGQVGAQEIVDRDGVGPGEGAEIDPLDTVDDRHDVADVEEDRTRSPLADTSKSPPTLVPLNRVRSTPSG